MTKQIINAVIVGGGFSGTMVAIQLLRHHPSLTVAVVDKGSTPGLGLAYGIQNPNHLLNVRAENMSAFPDEPDHLLQWARNNYDPAIQPENFLPRAVYGRYITSLLHAATAQNHHRFQWIHGQVLSSTHENEITTLYLQGGRELRTEAVVLALGNAAPQDLRIPGLTVGACRYAPSPWSPTALAGVEEQDDVLLIGSGLTSVDLAIALQSRGFKGNIHVVSRRGLLPQTHGHSAPWPEFCVQDLPKTTRCLLRLIRDQARLAKEKGSDWRSVIQAIRPVTAQIWNCLPQRERARFLRHVRPYWEVHRHRVAPDIGAKLAAMIEKGQVRIHAGRLIKYSEQETFAEVTFRQRASGNHRVLKVQRVINCTGSESDCRRIHDPFLASLITQGVARPDPLFLGLDIDAEGALLAANGSVSGAFYAIGPARKGRLWESIAVPELRVQAADLAKHLVRKMAAFDSSPARSDGSPEPDRNKSSRNWQQENEKEAYVFGSSR